jgi:hypothetical protein
MGANECEDLTGQRLRLAGSGLYGSAARTADEGPQTFAGPLAGRLI